MPKRIKETYVGMQSFVVNKPSERFIEKCMEIDPECTMTNSQVLDTIIQLADDDDQERQLKEAQSTIDVKNNQIAELKDILKQKETTGGNSEATIKLLSSENESLQKQLEQANACANENALLLQKQEIANRNRENELTIEVQPKVRQLLDVTSERLTKRYNTEITPGKLLLTMFLRYTVEKYSEWFYPVNTIPDSEIEKITGVSVAQWKKFLNGKES